MIRAVLFDLGHTIWDIGPDTRGMLEAAYDDFRRALVEEAGVADAPDARAIQQAVSAELAADAETYFTNGPELTQPPTHSWVARALRGLAIDVDEDVVRRLTQPLFATEIERLVVGEGTIEAVLRLADAGYRLGCVTNTLASQHAIETMLRIHGLRDVMDAIVVSAEEGVRKPHPRLFELALEGVRADTSETVFVGDSPYHDIAAAKAMGMRAVQTTQYASRPPIVGSPPPDATIRHLRELTGVLEAWRPLILGT